MLRGQLFSSISKITRIGINPSSLAAEVRWEPSNAKKYPGLISKQDIIGGPSFFIKETTFVYRLGVVRFGISICIAQKNYCYVRETLLDWFLLRGPLIVHNLLISRIRGVSYKQYTLQVLCQKFL